VSSTTEVQQLQRFCRHSCCRFVVPRTSGHRLTAESDMYCPRRGDGHLPGRQATPQTATGEPGMLVWTWRALWWVASGVLVAPAWCGHSDVCQWSIVQWHSAQTATCAARYVTCQTCVLLYDVNCGVYCMCAYALSIYCHCMVTVTLLHTFFTPLTTFGEMWWLTQLFTYLSVLGKCWTNFFQWIWFPC